MGRRIALIGTLAGMSLLAAAPSAFATTTTFNYTGNEQQFFVPDGVTSLHLVLVGGFGGGGQSAAGDGGAAGKVTADLAVTPGETLFIEVGGPGVAGGSATAPGTGGFNGGGSAVGAHSGGGGGGATDIRTVSGTDAAALASRLIVAGGGGGGGDIGGQGGAGGATVGGDGLQGSGPTVAGHGGTQTAGGAHGSFGLTDGSFGHGGNDSNGFGGGGGGGYYGGGAGGDHNFGAGGGSGYLGPRTSNGSFGPTTFAAGSAVLTYTAHAPDPPTLTGTSPASPDTSTTPLVTGSALAGSTVLLYTNPGCAGGTDIAFGTAAQFASPGIQVSVAERSTTTFYARASNSISTSPCSTTSVTYVQNSPPIDQPPTDQPPTDQPPTDQPPTSAPHTTITSHPKAKLTVKKTADVSFEFNSDNDDATFECKLDSKPFAACDSPQDYEVKPGDHTFSVRASVGDLTDPSPAKFDFTVKKKPKPGHHHN